MEQQEKKIPFPVGRPVTDAEKGIMMYLMNTLTSCEKQLESINSPWANVVNITGQNLQDLLES